MARYAENTSVPVSRSRDEIQRIVERYGAEAFGYLTAPGGAMIEFAIRGRRYRFLLPLPDAADKRFTQTPTGRSRTSEGARTEHDKAVRQAWRALALYVKAQLEAVEAGIVSFEVAFLPYVVLPSGRTVADDVAPLVEQAYVEGRITPLQIES